MEKKSSNKTAAILMIVAAFAIVGVAIWLLRPVPQAYAPATAAITPEPAKAAPRVSSGTSSAERSSPASGTQAHAASASISSVVPATVSTSANPTFPAATPLGFVPAVANQSVLSSQPAAVAPPDDITASARMYAAHASLRIPEVADPDSKSNKEILGMMVAKALAQGATPPTARFSAAAK